MEDSRSKVQSPIEQGRLALDQDQSDRGLPVISSSASLIELSKRVVAFWIKEGGHVRRE
jgi:hypothetical protein